MMKGFFITGTDTGVGKTVVAAALIHHLAETGRRVAGMKPVAAGCVLTAEGWRNDDALQLLAAGNVPLGYEEVNPFALPAAIAPHLAAREAVMELSVAVLHAHYAQLAARTDCVIVEGAGGWRVPLNDRESVADLAVALNLPVILVVGIRLGCLNHALLSGEAIIRSGAHWAGWVANLVDPAMEKIAENIATLETQLAAPRLATFPHLARVDVAALAAEFKLAAVRP
ncbi:MAG: dethiobiotin synthase [Pseudomonadota bacterium]